MDDEQLANPNSLLAIVLPRQLGDHDLRAFRRSVSQCGFASGRMGLDLLDITFRIEKAFQIEMSRQDFFELWRDGDIVAGDLYEFILRKMHLRDVGRRSVRLNEYVWSQIQAALHSATAAPLVQIQLGLRLEELFPRETRRDRWRALREQSPYQIAELDYPKFVRVFGFLLAIGVVVVEQRQIWQIPGANWFWPVLGIFAVWMIGETYLKLLSVCSALRNRFPGKMQTVKDLCRTVMSTNYAEICRGAEISIDQRSAVVWEQLVEILASALGVDAREVTFRSRLVGDLGAA